MKVLFICKKRINYDSDPRYDRNGSFGLINSAKFVCKYLEQMHIDTKIVIATDANDIDREVYHYDPDVVIIEALWVTPKKMEEILKVHHHRVKNRTWIVSIHSRIPFLSNEGIALEWLYDYLKLDMGIKIAANSEGTAEELSTLFKCDILKLLNMDPVDWDYKDTHKPRIGKFNIASFGSIRPLKNTLIQAIAAIKFAEDHNKSLIFHINANTSYDPRGNATVKNIENLFKNQSIHSLVKHPWYPHNEFLKIVKKMDIGLQVSYSETFNIVLADFVNCNVPVVASSEIPYLPGYTKADPNSVNDIVKTMERVWHLRWFREAMVNKIFLEAYNKKSFDYWKKALHHGRN